MDSFPPLAQTSVLDALAKIRKLVQAMTPVVAGITINDEISEKSNMIQIFFDLIFFLTKSYR
ncbi:MAG TPA: hypothetical protein VH562_04865 [Nitrosopumilaceae archaeon]